MSEDCRRSPGEWTRRSVIRAGFAVSVAGALGLRAGPAAAAGPGADPALVIRPRSDWAADLPATGGLETESAGDVRFLLVHHTASPNDYGPQEVIGQLRSFFRYHTSATKGWPDLAYNFLVDRFGGVWEGRTGSLQGPVKGSATGGSQGFAQLACFIGDFSATPPTPAARSSMLHLLAILAARYDVDTREGAQVSFVSRGSNRWPPGTDVTTRTIAGHRDMSMTTCPGDVLYEDVLNHFPAAVTALRAPRVNKSQISSTPSRDPSPSAAETGQDTATTRAAATPSASASVVPENVVSENADDGSGTGASAVVLAAAAGTATLAAAHYRRRAKQ